MADYSKAKTYVVWFEDDYHIQVRARGPKDAKRIGQKIRKNTLQMTGHGTTKVARVEVKT